MTELQRLYTSMMVELENTMRDIEKFEDGNKAAGTRVRKAMQSAKNFAQSIRVEVQNQKKAVTA
tara:strand:+ start:2969 stop:3160 length:192 start_codon:yes stop_codon:yes gene_type:complete